MREAVVDASVAVKWFTPEDHSAEAIALLRSETMLFAPAHWLAEAANALWAKCTLRHEMTPDELSDRAKWLRDANVTAVPLRDLITDAVGVAERIGASVYDALYVALARQRGIALVTADTRLAQRAHRAGEPYRSAVCALTDLRLA